MRDNIILQCPDCKRRNYATTKNKKKTTERLELSSTVAGAASTQRTRRRSSRGQSWGLYAPQAMDRAAKGFTPLGAGPAERRGWGRDASALGTGRAENRRPAERAQTFWGGAKHLGRPRPRCVADSPRVAAGAWGATEAPQPMKASSSMVDTGLQTGVGVESLLACHSERDGWGRGHEGRG